MKKESTLNTILTSALSLFLGIILIVATDDVLTVFNYIFVCIFAIIGVIQILGFVIGKDYKEDNYTGLIMGIVFVWLALIMYVYYMMIINILPIIFSLYLFITGSFMIIKYSRLKNTLNEKQKPLVILGILSILSGLLLIFQPLFGVYTYLKISGIVIILIALLPLLEFMNKFRNRKKNA